MGGEDLYHLWPDLHQFLINPWVVPLFHHGPHINAKPKSLQRETHMILFIGVKFDPVPI